MAIFQYRGRDAQGAVVTGRIEAANNNSAAGQLLKKRIIPLEIKETKDATDSGGFKWNWSSKPKIKADDVTFFARQLYTLLRAGVPIAQALGGLRDSTHNTTFKEVLQDLSQGLERGEDLTSTMRRHPKVFGHLFVNMVGVGEAMGKLPEVLLEVSKYLQQEKDIRDRVKAAMRYPVMVLSSIGVAITVLNVFVIPRFKDMFSKFGADLPLPTKIIVGFSDATTNYWYFFLLAGFLIPIGVKRYLATPNGRMTWDRFKLRLPVLGKILYGAAMARFARSFAITSNAGLPVVQALPLVAKVVDNVYLEEKFDQVRQGVERGEGITVNLRRTGVFPSIVLQMIAVGEDTGQLEDLLVEVSEFFEREVDYNLKGLSASIEPILIGAIGIIVLIVMLGVFLPLWGAMDVMKGKGLNG